MKKQGWIATACCTLAVSALAAIHFLPNARTSADVKPVEKEYALALERYVVADYSQDVTVTAPDGTAVDVAADGTFVTTQFGGTYSVEYLDKIVEVYVYQQKPTVRTVLVGSVKDYASVGETVVFPSAEIYVGIEGHEYYDCYLALRNGEEETVLEAGETSFTFTGAGLYDVEYRYEDVFKDVEVAKSLQIHVLDERTVLANELPTAIGVNNTLSLKNIVGYYQGVEYPAEVYILQPGESAYSKYDDTSLLIKKSGEYKIKAVSNVQGRTVEKEFSVKAKVVASSLIANAGSMVIENDATVPYYSINAGATSLAVSNTAAGDTFTYSKLIDVSTLTKNINLISFEIDRTAPSATLYQMRVRLVDAHDSTNFIGMFIWKSSWNNQVSYANCEYDTYMPGAVFTEPVTVLSNAPFDGVGHYNETNSLSYPMTMQFDAEEQAIYTRVRGARTLMRELKDPSTGNPWRGFTSNEAYLEVTFSAGIGKIHIFELLGQSITDDLSNLRDEGAIIFDRDGGFHNGVVGYSYSLPKTVANKVLDNQATVRLEKDGVDCTALLEDYAFTPTEVGEYTAVYSVTDPFGNLVEKRYPFAINETPNAYVWSSEPIAVRAMEYLTIPDLTPLGGHGNVSIDVSLETGGTSAMPVLVGRSYQITSVDAKLIVTAVDEIGYTQSHEFALAVGKYLYLGAENMPKNVRAGEEFTPPVLNVIDFTKESTDEGYRPSYTCVINGTVVGANDTYTVPSNVEQLSVVYKAGGEEKEYCINVLPEEITVASQFIEVETSGTYAVTDFAKGIAYRFDKDTQITMPYPVSANDLAISFSVLKDENAVKYQKIQIVLTEEHKESKQVVLEITDVWGAKPMMQALGHYSLGVLKFTEGAYTSSDGDYEFRAYRRFDILYNNSEARIYTAAGVKVLDVQAEVSGSYFGGFDRGVYLQFRAVGVTSEGSELILNAVGNQGLSKATRGVDRYAPQIFYAGDFYNSIKELGEELVVPKAMAYDVLQRNSTIGLTLIRPNGVSETLDCSVENKIVLNEYGTYRFVYKLVDAVGNESSNIDTTVRVTVLDLIAPEVTVTGLKDYKVGDTFVLPTVSASDNVSSVASLSVEYIIYGFDGDAEVVTTNAYTFAKAGEYTLAVYVRDEAGNITVKNVTFVVR